MTTLRGADPAVARRAIETGESLPGTTGFAGEVDGRLVRDVLGREPLYVERSLLPLEPAPSSPEGLPTDRSAGAGATIDDAPASTDVDPDDWAFEPGALAEPEPFPAGHVLDETGWRELWTLPDSEPGGGGEPVGDGEPVDDGEPIGDDAPDRERALDAPDDGADDALDALREAVDDALADLDPATPVAFSGGVDSGLVATATDGPLYVAGFPDSQDVAAAREAAAALDRELRVVEVEHDDVERAVHEVVAATGRTNAMDVAIAIPLVLVAEHVAADGHDRLALGQGADELFGGYAKVERAPEDDRTAADTVVGARDEVLASLSEQLPRDVLSIRAAGVEPVVPLLSDAVVRAALALPSDLLVEDDRRKVALREVAAERLPESIAERDKKALQYGSLVSRELDRLARQAGFKRRMDDHVGQYVENLVEE